MSGRFSIIGNWQLFRCLTAIFMVFSVVLNANALTPPQEGELAQYQKDGSIEKRKRMAEFLGNDRISPALVESVKRRDAIRATPTQTTTETPAPPPAWQGGLPSTGNPKVLVLLIDFPDYPASPTDSVADVSSKYFGDGNLSKFPYESLKNFYSRSSYGALNIGGNVLGWYRAKNNRSYYEQNFQYLYNDQTYPYGTEELIKEALGHYNSLGHDFTQYDNAGTGRIDALFVKWTGPDNGWSNFWWAYQSSFWYNQTYTIDGKKIGKYVWSWIKNPAWGDTDYQPLVDIHETGHLLGLPDYYDYDTTVGPAGGVGKLDMMDGTWGDHNAFSKSMLGWVEPTIVGSGEQVISLSPGGTAQQAVKIMPGASTNHFGEYFLVQYRKRSMGNDPANYPTDGLTVWHVNAALNSTGQDFQYNNSYTSRKLLRLVQADGLQQIENSNLPAGARADAGDFFTAPLTFGPSTTPNSNSYSGALTGVGMDNLSSAGTTLTARFGIGLNGGGATYTLSVAKSGTGTGTVTSSPSGINCGSDCSETYTAGTNITLSATPTAGHSFSGWSGACTGSTSSCVVSMNASKSVTATFTQAPQATLSIAKAGTGEGTVIRSGGAINCGSTCSETMPIGSTVTLIATPATGSVFAGWSGGTCTGTGSCAFSLSGSTTVIASFNPASGGTTITPLLQSNVVGTSGSLQYFAVTTPSGATNLRIEMNGGTGDADLYVKYDQVPTTALYDCRPYAVGNDEFCSYPQPVAGTYHIMLRAFEDFSGVTLRASYQLPSGQGTNDITPILNLLLLN